MLYKCELNLHETASQRGHWGSRIYISTDMYLDLTTMQYRYTTLLATRLHKPVPKCKIQKKAKKQWQTTMSLLWKTKVRSADITPMTYPYPFLWTKNIFIGLIYKKCNKIMSHRHLKKITYTKSNITYMSCTCH